MTVNTKLDYQNYLTCVEALTDSFFDEDGNYAPHIGRIMSVSLFLDFCVEDSGINMEEDNMIDQIFDNEEILRAFENEVQACMEFGQPDLRFGSAYNDAMAIVEQKKNSLINTLSVFTNQLGQVLTPENIARLQEVSKDLDATLGGGNKVIPLHPNKKE